MGKADLKEELKPLLKDWKWEKSVDELLDYWFEGENYVDKKIIGAIRRLRQKGIKCILATNQEKYRFDYMKNRMGLGNVFDNIYCSAEIGLKKPDEEYLKYINDDLKLKKEEIMFWDDRESYANAARSFGWQSYVYKNFEDFKKIIKISDWRN